MSVAGDAVSHTAMPLLVFALTGSGVVMGIVAAIDTLADFVFSKIAGAFADRGDRKRMMFLGDLGRALLTGLVPISVALGGPTLIVILLVTGPTAILRGVFRAGYLAAMPNLVGRSQLARGNGILETAYSGAFIIGPALAGFLVTVIGPGETLALDAVSYAISSVGLILIQRELKASRDRPKSRMVDDIREGVVFVARHSVLRAVILMFATTSTILTPVASAMTFRIVADLAAGPAAFGLTLTGLGVGTMAGAVIAARFGPETRVARVLVAAVFLMGVPLIAAALVPSVIAIVALTALSGAGEAVITVVYISVRAANSPDALLGRVASTARVMALGLMPIGALVGGVLIDTVGGTATLAVLGASLCVLAVAFSQVGALRSASLVPPAPMLGADAG